MVLRKLDLLKEAVEVFVEAIHSLPLHWGAWLELSNLVTNIEMVNAFCVYTSNHLHPKSILITPSWDCYTHFHHRTNAELSSI